MKRVAGLVLVLVGWLPVRARAEACRPITDVPVQLSVAGRYCFVRNLTYEGVGTAIEVTSDDVVVDLAAHSLRAAGRDLPELIGVRGDGVSRVEVRGGTVEGFFTGVALEGGEGLRVRRLTVRGSRYLGILVRGTGGAEVSENEVLDTGDTTWDPALYTIPLGIQAWGPRLQVVGNVVSGLRPVGEAVGIAVADAAFGRVSENAISNPSRLPTLHGIWVNAATPEEVAVEDNYLAGLGWGVTFAGAPGVVRDNRFFDVGERWWNVWDGGGNRDLSGEASAFAISLADGAATEGDAFADVVVALSSPRTQPLTLEVEAREATAVGGLDFVPPWGVAETSVADFVREDTGEAVLEWAGWPGAVRYRLIVAGPVSVDEWYDATICGETCRVVLADLAQGEYRWWVEGIFNRGTVTLYPGQTEKALGFRPVDDGPGEGTEGFAAALLSAAGGSLADPEAAATLLESTCELSTLTPDEVPLEGGTAAVAVFAAEDCEWTAVSTAPWLHLVGGGLRGASTLVLEADANPGALAREGRVALPGAWVVVRQLGSGPPRAGFALAPQGPQSALETTFLFGAGSGATDYEVEVVAAGTRVFFGSWVADDICGAGVCQAPAAFAHAPGEAWRVRGHNRAGDGEWTGELAFSGPAATGLAPIGGITTTRPRFVWTRVAGAVDYDLWLATSAGTLLARPLVDDEVACGSGQCAYDCPIDLGEGGYTWWVQPRRGAAVGLWDAGSSFTVALSVGIATLVSPAGAVDTLQPAFTWQPASGATAYYLWVNNSASTPVVQAWLEAAALCTASACAYTPSASLAAGTHTWWIQARSGSVYGPWSNGVSFSAGSTAAAPGVATLVAPSGEVLTLTPSYVWSAVPGATAYYLWVNDQASRPVVQAWLEGAVCAAASCSYTPAGGLAGGPHTWWIQARNAAGDGAWSAGLSFTPGASSGTPEPVTLIAPSGVVTTSAPTFIWAPVPHATDYYVWVNDDAGRPVVQAWVSAATACAGATCALAPAASLAPVAHKWWVQARNGTTDGPWSAGLGFTVAAAAGLAAPSLVAPSGSSGASPLFIWRPVAGASSYYLWVNDDTSTPVLQQFVSAAACSAAACQLAAAAPLAAGRTHNWWVQAWTGAVEGPWSAGLGFTVDP